MENTEKLMTQLYEKAKSEQDKFVEELKKSTPEQIIEQAYELVMREDILITFEDNTYLEPKEIKALLKIPDVLSTCYNHWLDCDELHMEGLRDTISDFAGGYAKSLEAKHKKHNEPER